MKQNTNFKIVVLGGGAAGWLTALFLRHLDNKFDITVIEDPSRPPIIAGESGTTTFATLLKSLKIDNEDFIKQTNATPKLGGRFKNWNGVGSEFIHCLQTDYAPWLDGFVEYVKLEPEENLSLGHMLIDLAKDREQDLYLSTILANNIPLAKAFYAYQFIEQNKVPFGASLEELPCIPMWHFESRAAAAYLKNIALSRDIKLIHGEYQCATQIENGDISSITLDGERNIVGDWFFDCSGFSRLLLDKVLKEPLIDYTDYFPARAVVAWWDEPCPCVTTNANAMKYGWSWNINLNHRSGNGYIYDPDHISLDQAVDEAENYYGYKIDPIANFSFTPGMMKQAWKNNVIAVGLSSGFLEPLEANGVQVIIDTLHSLQDIWRPTARFDEERRNAFNRRVFSTVDDIRDFLALHYRGKRRDTEFWKSHAYDKHRIPLSLTDKLERWRRWFDESSASLIMARGYSPTAWLMVIQALEIFDTSKLAERHSRLLDIGAKVLNNNYNRYKAIAEPFWTLEKWLENRHK